MLTQKPIHGLQVPVNETLYQSDVSGTRAMVADLKAQLEALAWQNNQMQEQLASKDTELLSRGQQVQGLNQLAMWWEGQVCTQLSMQHCCSTRGTLAIPLVSFPIGCILAFQGAGQNRMACKVSWPST